MDYFTKERLNHLQKLVGKVIYYMLKEELEESLYHHFLGKPTASLEYGQLMDLFDTEEMRLDLFPYDDIERIFLELEPLRKSLVNDDCRAMKYSSAVIDHLEESWVLFRDYTEECIDGKMSFLFQLLYDKSVGNEDKGTQRRWKANNEPLQRLLTNLVSEGVVQRLDKRLEDQRLQDSLESNLERNTTGVGFFEVME